jgi:hypothetical protein
MVMGDPRHGYMAYGDPGFGSFLRKVGGVAGRLLGVTSPKISLALPGPSGGGVLSKVGGIVRAHPGVVAGGAGALAIGAGAGIEALARRGGAHPMAGGMEVLSTTRSGRPKLVLVGNRVVNLQRRRKGISAAAISGAFRLARLAHAFGGAMRTGRRPVHRRK